MIRPARPADASVLTEIAFAAKRYWGYSQAQITHWRDELTITPDLPLRQPTWVWEAEGDILGFSSLISNHGHWSLAHLWVRPVAMRRGVGAALLTQAIEYLRTLEVPALLIDADPQAEAFYRQHGAILKGFVAAPLANDPDRRRPQLLIPIE